MEQESQKRKLEETACEPSNDPILCANNCGFFGSPSTNNLCSKCYKDYVLSQPKDSGGPTDIAKKVCGEEIVNKSSDGNEATGEAIGVGVEGGSSQNPEKRPANRCGLCRKRVGLTGFKCRCGETFCSLHRYSDKHDCAFNYKSAGKEAIAKANPVVKADKIEKI